MVLISRRWSMGIVAAIIREIRQVITLRVLISPHLEFSIEVKVSAPVSILGRTNFLRSIFTIWKRVVSLLQYPSSTLYPLWISYEWNWRASLWNLSLLPVYRYMYTIYCPVETYKLNNLWENLLNKCGIFQAVHLKLYIFLSKLSHTNMNHFELRSPKMGFNHTINFFYQNIFHN